MRALISVSDKTGIVNFASKLLELGYEIISTSGTLKVLKEASLKVIDIKDVTGFPEICEGRVKTLHPKVHGALLAKRNNPLHVKEAQENGIEFIDLVCVNLYPFVKTIEKEGATLDDAVENIDIGGPSMLRSAAKNFNDVTVVCDPADYDLVLNEIKATGSTNLDTRFKLAAKAFTHTADYDSAISTYMRKQAGLSEILRLAYEEKQDLRYGENPHQKAKFYKERKESVAYSLAFSTQIQGKELSYNNIQDANAALNIVKEFKNEAFVVGLKHMNPCGAAVGKDLKDAWRKAYLADPVSIYGGIVATNQIIDKEAARLMKYTIVNEGEEKTPLFLEVILAPGFTEEAKIEFSKRKNVRLLEYKIDGEDNEKQIVSVNGGLLVQDKDTLTKEVTKEMAVTTLSPSDKELVDLNFAWKIVKHVKSNAIVVVKDQMTVGVGAGQMNRVGSCQIALEEAFKKGYKENLVLASDGFLPFADTVLYASSHGVTSIVQPGGSIRDEDSIKCCNDKKISMLFTNMRHFKH